jgi:ubiquinone/menaquinone biosynthesis C-methylase UbiE
MNIIDQINRSTMRSSFVVESYASERNEMEPRELAMLKQVAEQARGKPILDIGVGGGRTVAALLALSPDYLGIDNCPEMIAACQRRFPLSRFELADARSLSFLRNESIFLANFSCNGIGMVSHEDRLLILREVYRVLQPGGVFLFSTHNQNSADHTAPFRFPKLELSLNPVRTLVRSARFVQATLARVRNRSRNRRHDLRSADYSMINDVCHNYGTMLYYINLTNQRRQLEQIGFLGDAQAYDHDGKLVESDSQHNSLAFIARKAARGVEPSVRSPAQPLTSQEDNQRDCGVEHARRAVARA